MPLILNKINNLRGIISLNVKGKLAKPLRKKNRGKLFYGRKLFL